MTNDPFVIFISTVFSTHLLVNLYLSGWVLRIFPPESQVSRISLPLLAFFTTAFPLGRLLARQAPSPVASLLIKAGSWYLGFMALASLLALMAQVFLLLRRIPSGSLTGNPKAIKAFWSLLVLAVATLAAGHWIALHPVVREVKIDLSLTGEEIRAVMVSDIHVGHMFHNSRVAAVVEQINSLDPDLVFLVGDVVDGDISEALQQGMVDELRRLQAPLGIFAVTGNHEYYAGKDLAVKTLESGGIQVLEDKAVLIDDRLVIAGRRDRQAALFGEPRLSLKEILRKIPRDLPVILLDHTPLRLEEARTNRVSLQLSGHTHRGQMFPFNFVTDLIYEEDWGLIRHGETLYYISCGVGTWGPPVRTSSRPEIVLLELRPSDNNVLQRTGF